MSNVRIKCSNCGAENESDNAYCESCGQNLTQNIKHSKSPDNMCEKKFRKPSSAIESLSFLVFASIFACGLGFLALCWFAGHVDEISRTLGDENVFQQIYNTVCIVGMATCTGIGIILAFVILLFIRLITKLNVILTQIYDIQENINKKS